MSKTYTWWPINYLRCEKKVLKIQKFPKVSCVNCKFMIHNAPLWGWCMPLCPWRDSVFLKIVDMCCIFWPAFGCCPLQTLVEIVIFSVFSAKKQQTCLFGVHDCTSSKMCPHLYSKWNNGNVGIILKITSVILMRPNK